MSVQKNPGRLHQRQDKYRLDLDLVVHTVQDQIVPMLAEQHQGRIVNSSQVLGVWMDL
jgi:hypothetical protein